MALSLNESPGYPSTQDAQVRCDLAETSAGRSSVFAADVSKFIPSRTLFTRIRVCEEMSQHHSKLNHVSTTPTEEPFRPMAHSYCAGEVQDNYAPTVRETGFHAAQGQSRLSRRIWI